MERRGFFGRMAAGVVAAVAGLCGVKATNANESDSDYHRKEHERWSYIALEEHLRMLKMREKLSRSARCVEACRIMQEHGLGAHPFGSIWFVKHYPKGGGDAINWIGTGDLWPDPVTALIEAEPLYLAWRKESETKRLADSPTGPRRE